MNVIYIVVADLYLFCIMGCFTIFSVRDFVYDFLLVSRNHKTARKIHKAQPRKSRILLDYFEPHMNMHHRAYRRYQKLYCVLLYTMIPQWIIVIVANFLLGMKSLYVVGVFAAINLVIDLVIRFQQDSGFKSRYLTRK